MKVNPGLTNYVREIRRLCEADEEKDPVDLFHRRTDRRGIYAEKTLNPVFKGLLGIKNKGIKPLGLTPLFFMRKMGLEFFQNLTNQVRKEVLTPSPEREPPREPL